MMKLMVFFLLIFLSCTAFSQHVCRKENGSVVCRDADGRILIEGSSESETMTDYFGTELREITKEVKTEVFQDKQGHLTIFVYFPNSGAKVDTTGYVLLWKAEGRQVHYRDNMGMKKICQIIGSSLSCP